MEETMSNVEVLDRVYAANTYGRAPVVFKSSKGVYLVDEDSKEYLDFGSGIGVMSLGYQHPAWIQSVTNQINHLVHTSNLFYNEKTALLTAALAQRTGFDKVFLSNSGAEANECLIKTARKWAHDVKGEGEHPIVTLVNSFHGRTVTTVTATGQDTFHTHFGPFTPGFRYVPAGDLDAMKAQLDKESCAAVLVEIVQGEGGVRALDAEYLKGLQALCHEKDVLFCVDEVQTGNGRTGRWFAFEHFGLEPDLVSTAKGLGNGLPIGATLMNEKTANVLTPGTHGSTFGGNPVACAGALAVLETIDDEFLAEVERKGDLLKKALEAVPGVKDVSGLGLMIGFSVEGQKSADIKAKALKEGLVVLTAKDRVRLLPPLVISDEKLLLGVEKLKKVIAMKD